MRIAVVTGASSGLGAEFAMQISKKYKGIDEIWLIARRKERLDELAKNINIKSRLLPYDITTEEFYEVYEELLEDFSPKICVLINNAGFGKVGAFEELDLDEQLNMIDLNIKALISITYISLPYLHKKAQIIQVASSAGFLPQPYFGVYAATKSFVLSFSRAIRYELISRNITVTAVCPGPVKTEFFNIASKNNEPSSFVKKLVLAKPSNVVKKALIDATKGKEISIYGQAIKGLRIIAKILPHEVILPHIKK